MIRTESNGPAGKRDLIPASYGTDRPMTRDELEERGFNPEVYIMTPRAYNWLKVLSLAEDQNLRAELLEKYAGAECQLTYEEIKPVVEEYVTALENLEVAEGPLEEIEQATRVTAKPNASRPSRPASMRLTCSCGRNYSFAC